MQVRYWIVLWLVIVLPVASAWALRDVVIVNNYPPRTGGVFHFVSSTPGTNAMLATPPQAIGLPVHAEFQLALAAHLDLDRLRHGTRHPEVRDAAPRQPAAEPLDQYLNEISGRLVP